MINSKNISFVVQGSIADKETVKESLDSIRIYFPKSKIILSTWAQSDPSNLDYDEIVYSNDTSLVYKFYQHLDILNNINRQIISTHNGIKKVNTKYAVKIRTDMVFQSNNLIKIFNDLKQEKNAKNFNKKIIIPYDLSINPKIIKILFHFNDFFVAGETSDIKSLFNIPLMSMEDLRFFANYKNNKKIYTFKNWKNNEIRLQLLRKYLISRFAPEQYIYKFAALKKTNLKFDHGFIYNSKLLQIHKQFIKDNILFKSVKDISFVNHKHKFQLLTDRLGHYTRKQIKENYENDIFIFDHEFIFFKFIQFIKLIVNLLSKEAFIKLSNLYQKI